MNRKIWKALGIAVCMLALAAPRAMAKTYEVWTSDKFAATVQEINNKSSDKINEIVLCDDIELTSGQMLTRGETTIRSNDEDHKITIKGSSAGITVTGEGTVLNLGEKGYKGTLTIDGKTSGGFVSVLEGATANMYENVTLQNWQFVGNACVVIMGSDSVFNMRGGVIEECSRAVMADSGTTFHMLGGKILNCVSGNDGGGIFLYKATFIMDGGIISGCEGRWGGGLYADNSTVTITGGTISGCTAAENGGGLYATNFSEITISGGTISECTAEIKNGGGLYADNSTITIKKGTISGCEGELGCGLYATNSSEITISGGTISGCKVGAGGGLFATNSSKITIRGGTISECSTTLDTGKGGGLYAENSTITISGGTIENNEAARGGGVALTNSTVTDEEPIRNWMVVGNKAYKTGGGIWLGEKVKWDISDRTKQIYNNQAIEQGADIFLEGGTSAIKLPNAANMGAKYHDSGINIDNWYNDNPRYTPSENGQVVEANKLLNGGLSLVASYKASPVRIEIDANGGVGGSGSQTVQKGTNVTLEAPTKEGHLFKGWKDEKGNSYPAGEDGKVNITATGDMTLTAEWKKLPSAENLPKTGDESPVLLWGAALAVSAAACFMLRRRK